MNVDPLAEQTPEWSPYAFCNNNPIRYNDPTGMSTESPNDDYKLLKSGKVELIKKTDDNFDRVYNEDKSKNVEVKKGLVGQLENKRAGSEKNSERGYYSSIGDQSTQHSKDYKSLFKFVSDNSNAEFSLTSFTHKGKDLIQLSTYRDSDASPSPFQLGIDNPNQNVSDHMHSHPGIRTLPEAENYSMGRDYQHSKTDNRQYPNNVYFPNSSRLYRVTTQGTQLIKKIKSSKDF